MTVSREQLLDYLYGEVDQGRLSSGAAELIIDRMAE